MNNAPLRRGVFSCPPRHPLHPLVLTEGWGGCLDITSRFVCATLHSCTQTTQRLHRVVADSELVPVIVAWVGDLIRVRSEVRVLPGPLQHPASGGVLSFLPLALGTAPRVKHPRNRALAFAEASGSTLGLVAACFARSNFLEGSRSTLALMVACSVRSRRV